MPAISVRLKTRTAARTGGDRGHNERLDDAPEYVDSERTHLNTVPVPMPEPQALADECLRRRQAGFEPGTADSGKPRRMPRTMAKNAVVSVTGIITFSTDAQPAVDALTPEEQDQRLQDAAEAVARQYNTDLAGLAIHRDESALHAHFTLHGYDLDGKPISKQMTKAALSLSQDTASEAFADLGITRGKRIGDRIKDGEPRSKTINRSVHQLHNDLPRELAAAEQRLADMQTKVNKTADKLEAAKADAADKQRQIDKLKKRLTTYQNRLDDRAAEVKRLDALVNQKNKTINNLDKQVKEKQEKLEKIGSTEQLPEPKTGTIAPKKQKPEKKSVFRKPKEPEPRQIRYYPVRQVHQLVGGFRSENDRLAEQKRRLDSEVRKRVKGYHLAREQRPNDTHSAKFAAVGQTLSERYGVILAETDKQVTAPPQKPATPAQIAAALYRTSREKWPTAHFTVSDQVAEKIAVMAAQDGRGDAVSFDSIPQNAMLIKAVREAERASQQQPAKPAPTSQPTPKPAPEPDQEPPSGPRM